MGRKAKVIEEQLIGMLQREIRIPDIAKHFDCSISAVKRAIKKLDDKLPMLRESLTPEQFQSKELAIQTGIRSEVAAMLKESLSQLVGTKLSMNDVKKLGDLYHKLWTIDRVEHDKSTENVAVAKQVYHSMSDEDKEYIDKLEQRIYDGEKREADERYEQEKSEGSLY